MSAPGNEMEMGVIDLLAGHSAVVQSKIEAADGRIRLGDLSAQPP